MSQTRIALLATLSDLHTQPIRYDLAELARLVTTIQPDLIGVQIERAEFEHDDLTHAPIEVRETLVPLARKTDIVVVPLGAISPEELRAPRHGWLLGVRRTLIGWLDGLMTWIQRTANGAREVNSAIVSHTCGALCEFEVLASGETGRRAWERTNVELLANIEQMAQRDPGARILVAVQCRRKHWLDGQLRRRANLHVVNYWEL